VHHGKHGSVDWKIVGWLALGSLPFAIVTLFVLKYFMAIGKQTTGAITFTLGIALVLTACALFVRSVLLNRAAKLVPIDDEHSTPENASRFKHLQNTCHDTHRRGSGCTGYPFICRRGCAGYGCAVISLSRMTTLKIVGTDLAHAIPLTAVAGIGHLGLGNVDVVLLGSLLIGSLPGIWVGSHLSAKIPERFLRPVLASILLLIGIKFILQ